MTRHEFRQYLENATKRVTPLRRSKPGISLCFDTVDAERAHNQVRNAKRMLVNAKEEAEHSVRYEQGGLDTSSNAFSQHAARIEAALKKAGV